MAHGLRGLLTRKVIWMGERLQKYLAAAGIASRRKSEELIRQGRVTVNGELAVLGVRVHPERDVIVVDGQRVKKERKTYIMLNKPAGVITTCRDPRGRTTVKDLLADVTVAVHPVGRLDYDSEGLLLLTNDGDLTFRLTHPRYEVKKTYHVLVDGVPSADEIEQLRRGILLADGWTAPAAIEVLASRREETLLAFTIHEGRNRQVRRMWAHLGYSVVGLYRVSFGPLTLGHLKPGEYRYLSRQEVEELWAAFRDS